MKDTVKVDTRFELPREGDTLLLCSDGLAGPVSDADLLDIVLRSPDLPSATARMIERANEAGGPDNITCVLARWVS
jgi:protein phosphatase